MKDAVETVKDAIVRFTIQVQTVMSSQYMSKGHFREDTKNWCQPLEKVAIVVIVDLP